MNVDNTDASKSKTLCLAEQLGHPGHDQADPGRGARADAKKREATYQAIQREHQRVSPFIIMFQQTEVAAHGRTWTAS